MRFVPAPKLSPDQILQIAQSKGYFCTTPRWRDDQLRNICKTLVKQGRLRRARGFNRWSNQCFEFVSMKIREGYIGKKKRSKLRAEAQPMELPKTKEKNLWDWVK